MTSDFSVYAETRSCVTVDTKGVVELLASIWGEVGGGVRKVEHVPEVVLCRRRDRRIVAKVFAAHMRDSPEEAVEYAVLPVIAERLRDNACVAVDEDHASLITVYIEGDDVGSMLAPENCSDILPELT